MNYAVYHPSKGKGTGGAIGNHIDRVEGQDDLNYSSFRHSDPSRRHLNRNYDLNKYCRLSVEEGVKQRIEEGYKGKKAIRKDAVKFLSHVMTGTHERMVEISNNKEEFDKWIRMNLQFIIREYGEENILRFTLHMDEKTPHLHAITVNLTKDGRLSGKEIFGNRKILSERQDRYASAMKVFGLERGVKGTGISHENAREYYARIQASEEYAKQEGTGIQLSTFDVLNGDYNKKVEKVITPLKTSLKSQELELRQKEKRQKETTGLKDWKIQKLEEEKAEQEKTIEELQGRIIEIGKEREKEKQMFKEERERLLFDKEGRYKEKILAEQYITWERADMKIREELKKISLEREVNMNKDIQPLIYKYFRQVNPTQSVWQTLNEKTDHEKYQEELRVYAERLNIENKKQRTNTEKEEAEQKDKKRGIKR